MLNEKRVKHMVMLALYETKNGKEELKAGAFNKKDYITFQELRSLVWMTIGYVVLVILLGKTAITFLLDEMSVWGAVMGILLAIVVYIGLLITYIAVGKRFYSKRHMRAYYETKKFKDDLAELELMYEKEDIDGEVV